jgi:hypothetical protein
MRGLPITPVRRRMCEAIALLVLLGIPAQKLSPASPAAGGEIVAIGDVHGAFDDFSAILRRAELIDANHHWSGGNSTLVQLGDLVDRGPKPREVVELVMSLEKQAPKTGGRVVPLLGNHEIMNIMGDLRYVTPENYSSFADKGSEKRQHEAYEQYAKWRKRHAELLADIPDHFRELNEQEWIAKHPVGFIEQRQAFGPTGKYGKWLRGLSVVAELDNIIFLHGGISPTLNSMKVDEINRRVQQEMGAFDNAMQFFLKEDLVLPFFTLDEATAVVRAELSARLNSPRSRHPAPNSQDSLPEDTQREIMQTFLGYGQWLIAASDGPLWFRGYSEWDESQNSDSVAKLLTAYGASHIVVGHTPQPGGRIRSRFGGKIFLIDTGMLSTYYPQGKASALEIVGNTKFTAQYMDQETVLLDQSRAGSSDRRPAGIPMAADQFAATAQFHQ